ncbi:MAG: aminotransferase class I/II-fold pyridoxal phosphate-dependent enzyme [Candidatus Thorarchaeota archaeon]
MKLEPFELERIQSEWEHIVDIVLTESGVEPLSIAELVPDQRERETIFNMKLGYSQTNGTIPLRETIASMYKGADAENILVTNGGAEANFISMWNFVNESDNGHEIILMQPNYMQIHGVVRTLGGSIIPWNLKMEGGGWNLDVEMLKEAISSETIAIAICNPNNPTGTTFDSEQLKPVVDIAEDADVWILSDEIYQGAEMDGELTPTIFDQYDKVVVTNSLSKTYGLPGLRLGWIATTDKKHAEELWAYSDYITICPTKISDALATVALQPNKREWLRDRATEIVRQNWGMLKNWLDERRGVFDYVPPQASSMCFPKHNLPLSSLELVERLRKEKGLLLVPGEHFGFDKHLRIGFGGEKEHLKEGLGLLDEMIQELCKS